MSTTDFRPLEEYRRYPVEEMRRRVRSFRQEMERRRTVREYSDEDVPREIIEEAIRAAGRAPSGANMQPWHFSVVQSGDVKRQIREAAEAEERRFYEERATEEWLEALEPLGTDPEKPFLERAPYLIAVFAESYGITDDGEQRKHYYVQESVGIATGVLITALHHAGLATLTHTPSPMNFLNEILERPENERPFLLLVTGFPAGDARVPEIGKKSLDEIATFL
ncbi:MAG: nitroreductase family protein [Candidatus Palauibacterales bacterium]|nr:nitroreductase family protein [Candidatus Palauibacterales bacterium]